MGLSVERLRSFGPKKARPQDESLKVTEVRMSDNLVIAGRAFQSRLIVGTGKYRSFQEMARAHAASGAEMVTVAVRRVNLTDGAAGARSGAVELGQAGSYR